MHTLINIKIKIGEICNYKICCFGVENKIHLYDVNCAKQLITLHNQNNLELVLVIRRSVRITTVSGDQTREAVSLLNFFCY